MSGHLAPGPVDVALSVALAAFGALLLVQPLVGIIAARLRRRRAQSRRQLVRP